MTNFFLDLCRVQEATDRLGNQLAVAVDDVSSQDRPDDVAFEDLTEIRRQLMAELQHLSRHQNVSIRIPNDEISIETNSN